MSIEKVRDSTRWTLNCNELVYRHCSETRTVVHGKDPHLSQATIHTTVQTASAASQNRLRLLRLW